MPVYLDMTEKGAWENIRKGNMVVLSDSQALDEAMEKKDSLEGITYMVTERKTFREQSDLCRVHFLTLKGESAVDDEELTLAIKVVDEDFTATVFFPAPDFPEDMTRLALLEDGLDFLWDLEVDEDVLATELEFADGIEAPLEDSNGNQKNVEFKKKGIPLFGEINDPGPTFCTFVEYLAEDFENPELLITEIGDDEEEGGVITALIGAQIGASDIQVY